MGDGWDRADHGLVERDPELAEIDAALAVCRAGTGQTVLVEGPVGTGKTQVLETGLGRARNAGMAVMRVVGSPSESNTPLAAIWHLAGSPQLDVNGRDRLRAALADAGQPAGPSDGGPPSAGLGRVRTELFGVLRDFAILHPVVLGIDDVQYLDAPSRYCFRYAARHLRLDAVLLLCAGTPETRGGAMSNVAVESVRNPGVRRLPIGCLSPDGVAAVVRARLAGRPDRGPEADPETERHARRAADRAFAQTGGNPLLVQAWIDECVGRSGSGPAAPGPPGGQPAPAGAFARMLRAFLRQLPRSSRDVLTALAILGEFASVEAVARLQGIIEPVAAAELHQLADVGLVTGGRFRSPVARDLVYEETEPAVRSRLHARVARLLDHAAAVPATAVADHLIAAGEVEPGWGARILEDAAHVALGQDQTDDAIRYLEHALAVSDGERRGDVLLQLATVAWRNDPAAAEDYLADTLVAQRQGALSAAGTETLASVIFAGGRVADALELVDGSGDSGTGAGIKSHFNHMWDEATSRSAAVPPGEPGRRPPARRPSAGSGTGGPEQGVALLSSSGVWTTSADGSAAAAARRLLEVSPLTDRLLPAIVNAVKVLAFADRVPDAESWARRLLAEADRRGARGWCALLAALLAEIFMLQGAFDQVIEQADRALALAPPRGENLFWVSPLASHVLAHTRSGRFVEAATYLDRPPPPGVFASVHGLGYLRARGQYYLATRHYQAALDDFEAMGRVVDDWGIDRPELVPWRLDAAEASLRLGRAEHAKELLGRQFAANATTNARTRGLALRLRAVAVAPRLRTGLLVQAVEELRRSGDRYELARTFADLGDVYDYAGDHRRAAGLRRKAWQLAEQCGARTLAAAVALRTADSAGSRSEPPAGSAGPARAPSVPSAGTGSRVGAAADAIGAAPAGGVESVAAASVAGAGEEPPPGPPPAVGTPDGGSAPFADRPLTAAPGAKMLSESERRVATLAGRGFSNRQIATRLVVTVSTVEQHLTRAYRKLGITRRQELPDLLLDLRESA
ncbi:MAG: helix-turn-helix transcriptional regulator [Frankia sp.]